MQFNGLALVIIDEQHRFGVHQRLALWEKGQQQGFHPHQLIMTATPIPRTLAMTAYADLDTSNIRFPLPRQTEPALLSGKSEMACDNGGYRGTGPEPPDAARMVFTQASKNSQNYGCAKIKRSRSHSKSEDLIAINQRHG